MDCRWVVAFTVEHRLSVTMIEPPQIDYTLKLWRKILKFSRDFDSSNLLPVQLTISFGRLLNSLTCEPMFIVLCSPVMFIDYDTKF